MFSRKKPVEIPAVQEPARPSSSSRNLLSSSRQASSSSIRSVAQRHNQPDYEESRNELLRGASRPLGSQSRSYHATGGPAESDYHSRAGRVGLDEDEENEVEAIKHQIKFTKQETLGSTRNALRIAREAEETARNTMTRLGDQSDRLANTENHLDLAKNHAVRADDQQKEIVALNRSIFRPSFTFNKSGKRDAHEQKLLSRHEEEKAEREEVRRQQMESRNRTANTLQQVERESSKPKAGGLKARLAQKSKYQFEATASDDELEDELDDNLDEISGLTGRLNIMSKAIGQEIDSQNKKLEGMSIKTDKLDSRIHSQTERLKRIK